MIDFLKKIFQTKIVLREFDERQLLKKEIILQGEKKKIDELVRKFIKENKQLIKEKK